MRLSAFGAKADLLGAGGELHREVERDATTQVEEVLDRELEVVEPVGLVEGELHVIGDAAAKAQALKADGGLLELDPGTVVHEGELGLERISVDR